MNNFKKYPLFYGILSALILVFIAGSAYNFYLYQGPLSEAETTAKRAQSSFKRTLSDAPSEEQLKISEANIKKLDEKLDFLVKDLSRASSDIIKKCPYKEGYQLVEGIRGIVNRWKQTCKAKGITLPEEMDFSFKRYYQPDADPAVSEAIEPLWKQACVLDYILGKLFNSKPEDMEMGIVSVQREVLPSEGVKRDKKGRAMRTSDGDEVFTIEPLVSARVPGSIDTLAYKFVFKGQTEVLRLFLNQLKSFDAMLVVRSVEVKPYQEESYFSEEGGDDVSMEDIAASAGDDASSSGGGDSVEDIAALMGMGGDAAAQPAVEAPASDTPPADGSSSESPVDESNTPIVTNNTSEFSVVIEYLEVIKDLPKKPAKKDDQAASSADE